MQNYYGNHYTLKLKTGEQLEGTVTVTVMDYLYNPQP